MNPRHYRINKNYPFEVVQSEQTSNDGWQYGFTREVYSNEGHAWYISFCLQAEHLSNNGEFKEASRMRLKIKYILLDYPEYKL